MILRRLARGERGQVIVTTALAFAAMVGMLGLVVDVGSWFGAQRRLQTVADAAALAGVQQLPDQASATTVARGYADSNWHGVTPPEISFPDSQTIRVDASRDTPGFFARVYGAAFGTVTVHAHAEATLRIPLAIGDAVPVAVPSNQACTFDVPDCFGKNVDLGFPDSGLSTSMAGLVDLCSAIDGSCGSASDLKQEIANGFDALVPVDAYYRAATGQKSALKQPFQDAVGRILLFPVFDPARSDSTHGYWVVSWAAFRLDAVPSWQPHGWRLRGAWVTTFATGTPGNAGSGTNYGVRVVALSR